MKYSKLLLLSLLIIGCGIIANYLIEKNKPIQINYIKGLEYNQTTQNMSIGDTIAIGCSAIFEEDIQERGGYFYDANGNKVYVKDKPIGQYRHKQEFYVVNNYRWKGEDVIRNEIAVFNAKTISIDSVRKYNAGYSRFFLLNKNGISTDYEYRGEGDFIGSTDYCESIMAVYEWRIHIKEEGDIYDGEIGDSILISRSDKYCNLDDVKKIDFMLKY